MLAGLVAGLFVVPAHARMSGRERLAMHHCATGHVVSCIHRAAIHRGIDFVQAKFIAWRESRYNPRAYNAQAIYDGEHAEGLYQFIPSTWARTPYARYSVYDPKWASLAYAWEIAHGGSGNWGF